MRAAYCYIRYTLVLLIFVTILFPYPILAREVTYPMIPDGMNDFPIMASTPGTVQIACYPGQNQSNEHVILQWKNENSLCLNTGESPSPISCDGASFIQSTKSARVCYWKDQKKIQLTMNTNAMSYNGCMPHATELLRNNPGGYSTYYSWQMDTKGSLLSNPKFFMGNLDKLVLSTGYKTDYYAEGQCAEGITDPLGYREPYAFTYYYAILGELTPDRSTLKNALFIQPSLWDSRYSSGYGHFNVNCGLQNPTGIQWIIADVPIMEFGLPPGNPGEPLKLYEYDLLPYIKRAYDQCLPGNYDINNIHLRGLVVGNELANTAAITHTFVDPKLKVTTKNTPIDGFHDPSSSSCTVNGWVCDPDAFDKPLTVKFYEENSLVGETVANIPAENAVRERCGGTTAHRFSKTLSLPTGTHQIIAKAIEYDKIELTPEVETTIRSASDGTQNSVTITCNPPVFTNTQLRMIISKFGLTTTDPSIDLTGDGVVNIFDYAKGIWKINTHLSQ